MTDRSRSVYASAPFKFIVDGEPLYIHADLVSLHSKPLDRMINGSMAEAQEGFAALEDVDEGTFVRFIEWAHKGYYHAAEFTTLEIESPCTPRSQNHDEPVSAPLEEYVVEVEAPAEVAEPEFSFSLGKKGKKATKQHWANQAMDDDLGTYNRQSRKDMAQDLKEVLKEAFQSRKYTVRQSFFEIPPPRSNKSPEEDYTDVFLSHAQLYVFAEKYDIEPLKVLALEELHATLVKYFLYPVRTGDIITLLRYVYANSGELREGVEDMRTLMTQYVGFEMDTLIEDPEFGNLMFKDRDILGDFMKMVAKRISSYD